MKRALINLLTLAIVVSFAGCGSSTGASQNNVSDTSETVSTDSKNENKPSIDYPIRNITVVVPNAAGGGLDVLCRMVANAVTETSAFKGKTLIIENMPGGGAILGQSYVANADGDGYTILACTASVVNNTILNETPFTPDDFRWLGIFGEDPPCMIVPLDSPINTAEDFVNAAKERSLVFSTGGHSTLTHIDPLVMADIWDLQEPQFLHCDSSADQMTQVMGNHSDVAMMTSSEAAGAVTSGQVKCIGIFTEAGVGSFALPDVLSFCDQGYDFVETAYARGLAVPANTPDDIYEYLVEEFKTVFHSDNLKDAMSEAGNQWVYRDAEGMQEWADSLAERTNSVLTVLQQGM